MALEGKSGHLSYSVDIVGRRVKLDFKFDGDGVDLEAAIYLEIDRFMDLLANAIPGQIDDAIFGAIKAAIK